MADVTLQSFVIKLKYLVDETTAKHFHENIQKSVAGLTSIKVAALGAMAGIEEMVRRTTSYYSSLDYLTRSIGASADEIERFRAEIVGAGGSASQADAVLTSIADKFRTRGWQNAASSIVGGPVNDAVDFMEKAAKKYHELLVQFHNDETAGPLVAMRAQMEGLFGPQANQLMQNHARNWDLAQKQAAETAKIYEMVRQKGESLADAQKRIGQQSTEAQLAFTNLGKTLQVAIVELLTRPGPDGKTLLQVITELVNRFSEWIIKPETQQALRDMFDRLAKLLPMIEWALTHIDKIIEGLLIAFGVKKVLDWTVALRGAWNVLKDIAATMGLIKTAQVAAPAAGAAGGAAAGGAGAAGAGAAGAAEVGGALGAGIIGAGLLGLGAAGYGLWKHYQLYGFGGLDPGAFAGDKNSMQEGGIVDATLHHGEMVLPASISSGLQTFFQGGAGSFGETSRRMLQGFLSWFSGDTAMKPQVQLTEDTLDQFAQIIKSGGTNRDQTPAPGVPGSTGTGGGETGSPAPGAGGAQPGALSAAAAELISRAEGTFNKGQINYNEVYGGGTADLANMTIAQVLAYQEQLRARLGHSPVGAFQITANTLREQAKALKLDLNTTMFGPETQRLIAGHLLGTAGIGQWSNTHPELMRQVRQMGQLAFETGTGAMPGGGRVAGGPGTMGSDPALYEIMTNAFKQALPEGYTAQLTSGERSGNPRSGHFGGHAEDWQIYQGGKALSNRGEQYRQLYSRVATAAYLYAMQKYGPEAAKKLGWGGHFGTQIGGGGEADLMHFDWLFRGIRGHIGNPMQEYNEALRLYQQRQNYANQNKPQQVSQNVTYHVYNNDSPSTTAKRIQHTQNRDLAALTRNNRAMVG